MNKKTHINYSNKKCPDELMGVFDFNSKSWVKANQNKRSQNVTKPQTLINPLKIQANSNSILIVLESPHIDEYDIKTHYPIAPLNGSRTKFSNNFYKYINTKLPLLSGQFNVYLINAIQYQCSLGISNVTKLVKEINFANEWGKKGKRDFIERMNKIIKKIKRNDFFIINCCTKGQTIKTKEFVESAIKEVNGFDKQRYARLTHPSIWK